ncbi:CDP-alcohol phosphatidyltransferase family protein [Hydrocarboniphaga effusa]|uniref:CDP-alcohol phosphatidyltransferase family protein n=1 Tax=Hydrocarboniphaga effusa TaxID=243629 RepID=UPI003BA8528E
MNAPDMQPNGQRLRVAVELLAGLLLLAAMALALQHWTDWPLRSVFAAFAVLALVSLLLLLLHWNPPQTIRGLGHANRVTLLRATLVALVAGSVAAPQWLPLHALLCCALALAALALDGLDGAVARRTRSDTAFGASFDMELDAFFILVLSFACWIGGRAGAWVLAIGFMRYAMLVAAQLSPRLRGKVPPSFFARLVCVLQIAALVIALLPWTPLALASALLAIALALLTVSFGRDVVWLLGRQQAPTLT